MNKTYRHTNGLRLKFSYCMNEEKQTNFYLVIDEDGDQVMMNGHMIPKHKIVTGYDELTEEK